MAKSLEDLIRDYGSDRFSAGYADAVATSPKYDGKDRKAWGAARDRYERDAQKHLTRIRTLLGFQEAEDV